MTPEQLRPELVEGPTTVFTAGEAGYHTFRIPAIVRSRAGTLLAFAEARRNDPSDDGDIDLVVKRSVDNGRSWLPLSVVDDAAGGKSGNPVPIVDRRTGRIVLNVARTSRQTKAADVLSGRAERQDSRRPYILTSDDDGLTWSTAREITDQVKQPDWRHWVGGPGHGIQLQVGDHAGRLVIAANHSTALPNEPADFSSPADFDQRHYGAHAIYSDDGGRSWQLGGVSPGDGVVNPNESAVVELPDATLYFNARDQHGGAPGNRAATVSQDGGTTFVSSYRAVPELISPIIQAGLLAVEEKLIFSAPADPDRRRLLQLRLSSDLGGCWQPGPVVHDGPAGYSDLVDLEEQPGRIGILYECGDPGERTTSRDRIDFARVDL